MPDIVLPAQRHHESSRGTPRLRRPLLTLHGARRLAVSAAPLARCAVVSLSQRVEVICRAALLSVPSRGHYLDALRYRSLLGHGDDFVQSGSFCRGTFPARGRLTARNPWLAAAPDFL